MNFFQKSSRKSFHFINIQKQIQLPKSFKSNPNEKQGFEYRLYISNGNEIISFWHDINLKNIDNTFKIVVEIPKNERAKIELAKNEAKNPLRFDYIKTDDHNVLRYFGIDPIFNIGFFPQTLETLNTTADKKFKGIDDPLNAIEIGQNPLKIGEIVDVYVLGSFCVLDKVSKEADWKIVVINRYEAEKHFLDYVSKKPEDFEHKYINDIMNWHKIYKTFEGSNEKMIQNEKLHDIKESLALISNSHHNYLLLKDKKIEGIDYLKYNFDI